MSPLLRLLGQVLGGLTVLACLIGWACWVWLSGGPWRRHSRRRYVTRPVRATLQFGATAAGFGLVLAPAVTATVLATLGLTLVGLAAGWRYRLHLDQRAETRAGRVSVVVGEPVPNRPKPDTARPAAVAGVPAGRLEWKRRGGDEPAAVGVGADLPVRGACWPTRPRRCCPTSSGGCST